MSELVVIDWAIYKTFAWEKEERNMRGLLYLRSMGLGGMGCGGVRGRGLITPSYSIATCKV